MTVETATYISQLNTALPTSTDPKSEGDDHLRLVKSAIKATFPNFGAAALSASNTQLDKVVTTVSINASAPAAAVSIDASGNVGFGTPSPAYQVDVRAAEPTVSVRKPSANSNFYGYNIMANTDIVSAWLMNASSGQVSLIAGYSGYGGFFTFTTNGTECVRFDANGNSVKKVNASAPSLTTNQTMVASLPSDTQLRFSVRGSDGVTRTANITLS